MAMENLILEVKDGIARMTFNRPDRMNALNRQTIRELDEALSDVEQDGSVRILVLTGAGDKAFAAGADIDELAGLGPLEALQVTSQGHAVFSRIERFGKPTIAAVNGYALGGGCEIAMACSLRLASEKAKFGFPEVGIGAIPGYGGTQRLPRLVGKGRALELLLTGDPIPAAEAYRIGLVNRVTSPVDLIPETERIARRIMENGPAAVRMVLNSVNRGSEAPMDVGCWVEALGAAVLTGTEDMKEGAKAFVEKRRPVFRDR